MEQRIARRRVWQSLSAEEKQRLLAVVRERHQRLIASEARRLPR